MNQSDPKHMPEYFSTQIVRANRFYRRSECKDFSVLAGGRETCAAGYRIDRTTFPYHAIEFVVSGHGEVVLGSSRLELSAGVVFCYAPGIRHRIRNDRSEPLEKFFINISGERAANLLDRELALSGRVLHTSAPSSLLQTFEELIRVGLENPPWSDKLCNSLAEVLAYKIAGSALEHGTPETTAFSTFRRCRNFIGVHFTRLRTLQELCYECGVSPSYLCRLFRQFDHQSPYQYLLRLKMNLAAQLLLEKHLQVQEVSRELGFEDPLHFSRSFKSVIGMSPARLIRFSSSSGFET
jgi:AraC-like DNA-binding protein/mannose-6-phosphate isomerase-like protein (cupin superfamily)